MEEALAEAADLVAALTEADLAAVDLAADPVVGLAAVLADREVPVGDMAAIGADPTATAAMATVAAVLAD